MTLRRALSALRSIFKRRQAEADIDDEIASHIEFQARKHIAAGMTGDEARRRARIELGGLQQTREQVREVDRWRWLDVFSRNLKYAVRSLTRTPLFSCIAILLLAIGVGSNLAIFAIIDFLLFRPLPVDHPEQLVRIAPVDKQGRHGYLPSTIIDPLKRAGGLTNVCGFNTSREGADIGGTLRSIYVMGATGDCFPTIGIHVQLGRVLTPADDVAGAGGAAVISASFWRSAFDERRDVLGKTIRMAGLILTVVGVAEDRFEGLLLGGSTDVIFPLHQEPSPVPGAGRLVFYMVMAIARRNADTPERRVAAAIEAQNESLLNQSAPSGFNAGRRRQYLASKLTVTSCKTGIDFFLRERFGQPLYTILGICGAVLVIACVNLANLLLARSIRRRREFGMRLALGANRSHVAGILALESTLIVFAGAAGGLLFAFWADRLIGANASTLFGVKIEPAINAAIPLYAAVVLLVVGAFALAAAWQSKRVPDTAWLQGAGRGVVSAGGRAQKLLLGAQIALTLALVAVAGLFGTSMRKLYQLDLGLKTGRVWDVLLATRPDSYENPNPGLYYRDLLSRVEALPGVAGVTLSNDIPFYNAARPYPVSRVENAEPGEEFQAQVIPCVDRFVGTLGIRIVAGEDFRRDEQASAERTVLISQALADRFGGAQAILGHHIRITTQRVNQRLKVAGVTSDAQLDLVDPTQHRPLVVYLNLWSQPQEAAGYPVLLIKTKGPALDTAQIRRVVDSKGLEYVDRVDSLDAQKDAALVENRIAAYVSGAFGVLALVLAATGLFGLLSYQVANHTAEIGVRVALGARRGQIQWFVVRQVLVIVAAGSVVGVALSLAAGQAIAGLLYGISGSDPWLLAVSFAVLAATALLAAWLPARRAAAVDPVVALRHE